MLVELIIQIKYANWENGTALAIGSEYECDPGDGTNRTFFVLENTDATKVSLIMDRNIDDTTIPFCDQSNDSTKTNAVACQADALQAKIASTTSDWTKVTVTLPAANQIAKVTNTNVWDSTTSTSSFCFGSQASNQYKWLYNYTNGCSSYGCDESTSLTSGANGYWTSSLCSGNSSCAWGARKDGCLIGSSVSRDNNFGVRPVIIISKSNIS